MIVNNFKYNTPLKTNFMVSLTVGTTSTTTTPFGV